VTYAMNDDLRAAADDMVGGRLHEALDAYARIAATQPEHAPIATCQVGVAYFFLGMYPAAIKWYERAAELGYDPAEVAENVAEAREHLGRLGARGGDIVLLEDGSLVVRTDEATWAPYDGPAP